MSRPDEGLIHAWLDGELDAAEAARVERLVRDDAAWAAAAAEARGFIAASDRILRSLDDVPANVVPAAGATPPAAPDVIPIATRAPERRMPWWTMRVAALLIVAVGVTIVVRRSPDDVTGTVPAPQPLTAPAAPAVNAAPQATQQATPLTQQKPAAPATRTAEAEKAPAAPAPEARALVAPQAAKAKEATNAPANVVTAPAPAPAAAAPRAALGAAAAQTAAAGAATSDEAKKSAAALADAPARAERMQATPKLAPVTTTSAGERRAAAAPEIVCYRAQGGAVFRTQRLTDSTVARLAPDATRMDVPPLRVRGDSAFLVPTGVAFRVSCPATP